MLKDYSIRDFYFWKVMISLAFTSFYFASMYAVKFILLIFVTAFDVGVSVASLTLSFVIIGSIIGLFVIGFYLTPYLVCSV